VVVASEVVVGAETTVVDGVGGGGSVVVVASEVVVGAETTVVDGVGGGGAVVVVVSAEPPLHAVATRPTRASTSTILVLLNRSPRSQDRPSPTPKRSHRTPFRVDHSDCFPAPAAASGPDVTFGVLTKTPC
jgi:hypothetical protein